MSQSEYTAVCNKIGQMFKPHIVGTNDQKRKKRAKDGQLTDNGKENVVPSGPVPAYSKRIYVRFPSYAAHRYHLPQVKKIKCNFIFPYEVKAQGNCTVLIKYTIICFSLPDTPDLYRGNW